MARWSSVRPGVGSTALIVLVSLVAAVLSARVTFGLAGWLWNLDLPKIHYPLAVFLHEAVSEGRLPLWSDRLGFGFPLYAEGQIGAFYPPHWLTFQLEPLAAMDLTRVLHLGWAGTGIGLLARRVSGSVPGALVAVLVGVLAGAIVTKLEWWNLLAAYAWIPWVLLPLAGKATPSRGALATAGILWGVQALAGHPNTWLLTGLAALLLLWRRPITSWLTSAAIFGVIGAAVGAVQLVPTLILQRLSVRSVGLTSDDLFTSAATPFDALGLGFVNAFTRSASDGAWDFASTWYPDGIFAQLEGAAYVGLPALGLAAMGAVTRRGRRWVIVAAGMALVAVAAAFRPDPWLAIPVLNGIRSPTRAYLLVVVAIAILAAIGTARLGRDRSGGRPAIIAIGVAMAAYVLTLATAAGAPALFEGLLSWSTTGGVDAARADEMRRRAIETLVTPWPAIGELAAGTLLAMVATWRRSRRGVRAAVVLVAIPLIAFAPSMNPVRGEDDFSFASSPLVTYLRDAEPRRVLVTNPPGWWEAMPNQLPAAGIPDADMFSSLNLVASDRLVARLREDGAASDALRRAFGVDTTVTVDGPCPGTEAARFEQPATTVCRVDGALRPPVWIPDVAVEVMADAAWPPAASIDPAVAVANAEPPLSVSDEGSLTVVEVHAPGDGWLFIDRAWWPAWRATVDGVDAPIMSGDGGQLIEVSAGTHRVAAALVPWDAGLGLALAVVVLAGVVVLLPRRPRSPVRSEMPASGTRSAPSAAPAAASVAPSAPPAPTVEPGRGTGSADAGVTTMTVSRRHSRRDTWLTALVIGSSAAALYLVTVSERVQLDSFLPLANAFLDGRLHIAEPMPWLELIPRPEGGFYTPFPPMPAVVLLPFVILFGSGFDQGIATALFGGANVALVWLLLGRVGVRPAPAGWLTAAFGIGSVHWWAAGAGSVWLHAQVVAVFFALLALHLTVRRRWPIAAGLLLGCAAASRLPMGLTLPFYLAVFLRLPVPPWVRMPRLAEWRSAALFAAGLAVPALLVATYNVARYGSPTEFGYGLIPGVLDEPWYASGILSIEYIPRHLHLIFMRGFDFVDAFPWFRPNWSGASLVLTFPIFLWLAKARSRRPLIVYAWLAIALGMLPNLLHGAPGFAQFGYRFVLDVLPIVLLLLGWVFRDRMSVEARAAIVIGILVNAYGVWAVTVADFVSF